MAVVLDKEAEEIFIELGDDTRKDIRDEVKVFSENLRTEGTAFAANMKKLVNERGTLSKARLIENLESDLRNVAGRFGEFKSETFRQAKILSFRIQNAIYESNIEGELDLDKQQRWMWQAVFVKTCPSCIDLHGNIRTMKGWDEFGHPKSAPTICDGFCQCNLIPIDSVATRAELRKPIVVEADRIRRTEIKRGRDYSPSYKSQIVGNLNNPEFRKTLRDLRKVKKLKVLRTTSL